MKNGSLSDCRTRLAVAALVIALPFAIPAVAAEYHVSTDGRGSTAGSAAAPFRTIQRAAELAQPGDTITVHEGIYREEVSPPRGGTSDARRITYRAAPGEHVEIRGSEVVSNWAETSNGVWMTDIPNALFGEFNPFADEVAGDWFDPRGRKHHTGCVYLDGQWLFEAAAKEDLYRRETGSGHPFINMAWFSVNGREYHAADFSASENLRTAESTEPCGSCIGWIYHRSWARYTGVDFGDGAGRIDVRLAIPSREAVVEIRLDGPAGRKVGTCRPTATGGWQAWETFPVEIEDVSGENTLCIVFREPAKRSWFAEVGKNTTTVWADFGGDDPNLGVTEVNVRRTVFYPRKPFVNYITVRGFSMRHAAPRWAPPTAEQMGLLGTHWSRGWITEDNTISHSINAGISLGKYGDEHDNAGPTAQAYLDSIDRARANGWDKATIGSHLVRNNEIAWCEQAGIVGSMGAAFSEITGNHVHHIYTQRRFGGAEMAGIKFHAPIDMLIEGNRIHDAFQGIWLDWMTQGTRVTRNLLYRNDLDLFLEVNHGPFLVDNNLFLSNLVKHHSQGGAYVHNLFGGVLGAVTDARHTPYFRAHSTDKAGDHVLDVGDDRFHNNMFIGNNGSHIDPGWWEGMKAHPDWRFGHGLWIYETRPQAPQTGGNVYYDGARPYSNEVAVVVETGPEVRVEETDDAVFLHLAVDPRQLTAATQLVTSALLGIAAVPQLPFETPEGEPFVVDTDYFGKRRDPKQPAAGPFARAQQGRNKLQVWPHEPKNVLFMVADDLNCYIAAYGHRDAVTPNMDRLARQGTLFTAAMCQFPVCGPSRSSFMTGRRPGATGILSNGPSLFEKHPDIPTLASVFKESGYTTARAGKIYNSADNSRPLDWDELLDAPLRRENRARSGGGAGELIDGGHQHWRAEWRAPDCEDADLPDGADTEALVRWISRNAETPFFLAAGFRKPHQPLVVPKRYFDLYDRVRLPRTWTAYRDEEIPDIARNTSGRKVDAVMTDAQRAGYTLAYHAAVSYIDAQVGKLLDALEAHGIADQTVVVLFGDNGFHVGEHRTWGKNTLFEPSARVPLIIADPAGRKGQTCEEVVELIDLFPTLLESCGLDTVPGLEGRSLVPLLNGRPRRAPPRAGFTQVATGWSVRTPRWRLMNVDPKKPELMLYDLVRDPDEFTNQAHNPDHAMVIRNLSRKARMVGLR